jgi:hypothetical protein
LLADEGTEEVELPAGEVRRTLLSVLVTACCLLERVCLQISGNLVTKSSARATVIVEPLLHGGRVLEQADVVLSSDDGRSFLDKHVELWRVEPVFHSLDLHNIFMLPLLDTLLFTVAFSLPMLVRS